MQNNSKPAYTQLAAYSEIEEAVLLIMEEMNYFTAEELKKELVSSFADENAAIEAADEILSTGYPCLTVYDGVFYWRD